MVTPMTTNDDILAAINKFREEWKTQFRLCDGWELQRHSDGLIYGIPPDEDGWQPDPVLLNQAYFERELARIKGVERSSYENRLIALKNYYEKKIPGPAPTPSDPHELDEFAKALATPLPTPP